MRYSILLTLFVLACACAPRAPVFGVATGPWGVSFDHYAINVDNLAQSTAFYQRVLGLAEIEDGTGKDHIRWFSLGNGMSLHVIEADRSAVRLQKGVHLSVAVADFDGFVAHLRQLGLRFWSWQGVPDTSNGRPDGVRQVYLQDPDGYWIEVNDNRVVAAGRRP